MTLGALTDRIADELNRSDLSSQIELAVRSAITFYSAETLYFQQERVTTNTVDAQEYYALPEDVVTVNTIRATINSNNDYLLHYRTNEYFEAVYQPSSIYTGYPQDWTIYDQQLRLGPIPDGAYPLVMHYIKRLASLGSSTDSNDYTDDIEEQLIRARAKWDVYTNVIKDYSSADRMKIQEAETLAQVKKKSSLFVSNTQITRYL